MDECGGERSRVHEALPHRIVQQTERSKEKKRGGGVKYVDICKKKVVDEKENIRAKSKPKAMTTDAHHS